jgi:hypothetical protein
LTACVFPISNSLAIRPTNLQKPYGSQYLAQKLREKLDQGKARNAFAEVVVSQTAPKSAFRQRVPTDEIDPMFVGPRESLWADAAATKARKIHRIRRMRTVMGLSGKATDDNQLSAIREQLLLAARKGTRTELLLIYRNLTDEALDQYIMLLGTPELTIYKPALCGDD